MQHFSQTLHKSWPLWLFVYFHQHVTLSAAKATLEPLLCLALLHPIDGRRKCWRRRRRWRWRYGEPIESLYWRKAAKSRAEQRRRRWRLERFSCGQLSVGSSRTCTQWPNRCPSLLFLPFARVLCGIIYDLADVLQLHLELERLPQAMQPALSAACLWDGSQK